MKQGMSRQRGAALIVVLALLAGALIVGVSGMQSSLIDERLAGNYRASAQAQMNAEEAVAEALDEDIFALPHWSENPGTEWLEEKKRNWDKNWIEEIKELSYQNLKTRKEKIYQDTSFAEGDKNPCEKVGKPGSYSCFYFPLKSEGDHKPGNYVVAVGAVSDKADENLLASRVILIEEKAGKHPEIPNKVGEAFDQYTVYAKK